eukprot:SAG11_NODE_771_length_7253_cov_2.635741_1_plen_95_part_00
MLQLLLGTTDPVLMGRRAASIHDLFFANARGGYSPRTVDQVNHLFDQVQDLLQLSDSDASDDDGGDLDTPGDAPAPEEPTLQFGWVVCAHFIYI